MPNITIVEEKPLTLIELKEKILAVEKRDNELSMKAQKTRDYLAEHASKSKKVEELKKALADLQISRLKERHIVKLIDLAPKNIDEIRSIFAGENLTVKQEDLTRILDTLK
jgi:DNA-directed RNA polymerase subunit F